MFDLGGGGGGVGDTVVVGMFGVVVGDLRVVVGDLEVVVGVAHAISLPKIRKNLRKIFFGRLF